MGRFALKSNLQATALRTDKDQTSRNELAARERWHCSRLKQVRIRNATTGPPAALRAYRLASSGERGGGFLAYWYSVQVWSTCCNPGVSQCCLLGQL